MYVLCYAVNRRSYSLSRFLPSLPELIPPPSLGFRLLPPSLGLLPSTPPSLSGLTLVYSSLPLQVSPSLPSLSLPLHVSPLLLGLFLLSHTHTHQLETCYTLTFQVLIKTTVYHIFYK